jgi:hypothetical protein
VYGFNEAVMAALEWWIPVHRVSRETHHTLIVLKYQELYRDTIFPKGMSVGHSDRKRCKAKVKDTDEAYYQEDNLPHIDIPGSTPSNMAEHSKPRRPLCQETYLLANHKQSPSKLASQIEVGNSAQTISIPKLKDGGSNWNDLNTALQDAALGEGARDILYGTVTHTQF